MKQFGCAHDGGTPMLSIVCAVRNGADCLQGLLDSYRSERSADTELVVFDGASTDKTWEIVENNRDIIDNAVSECDKGIYDAWNKALPICRGRYVAFIGADDRLAAGSLISLISACRENPDAHIVAGFIILTRRGVPTKLLGEAFDRFRLHRRMMIAHVMSAHRIDWLCSVGGFDARFRSSGDYELLLRQRASIRVHVTNVILAFMEDGGTSRRGMRPYTEDFHARRINGYQFYLCAILFVRAMVGVVLRRLQLRR